MIDGHSGNYEARFIAKAFEADETKRLLNEALEEMEAACEQSEGRTHAFILGCGNCDAGVPMRHSLGCRIRRRLEAK